MRLYGSFTNNAAIVFNTYGNEIQFAPYNASGSQVYNGIISGSGGQILPRGAGTTILNGANTFNDSGVSGGTGPTGYSLVLSGSTLGVGADSVTNSGGIVSSPVGTGNLGVDVTLGNVSLFANGGAHTIANPIIYTSDSNTVLFTVSGSNNLTLSGQFNLSGNDGSGSTNQTIVVNNTGLTRVSGVITDNGLGCGLIKAGTNALYLDAVNSYYGSTIVSNGMLAGMGTIVGPVAVDSTGTLGAGDAGVIGTLTVSSNLTVGGNLFVRVNTSLAPAQSNDIFSVSGLLANDGTGMLSVSNLGPSLVAGDRFVLFSKPVSNGGALTVTGAGVNWTNRLAVDGSISVLAIAPTVSTNAFTVTNSYANGVLKLTWPLNHTGYRLQAETNSLAIGLSNNWVTVSSVNGVSPAQTNQVSIPVSGTGPAVFFRLIYP
jgi:autotransporter-associated beta strand protein